MVEKLKVALSQLDIVWEDKQANYRQADCLAQAAFAAGAHLLLLPEMSFTGFSMRTAGTAEDYPYETVAVMKKLSEKYPGLAICFGFAGRGEGSLSDKVFNCMEVVQNGESLMHYKKLHPFTFGEEGKHFTAGSEISSFLLGNMKIGGFICYDLRFPEIFQISSKECGFIFVIANWPKERALHWKVLLQARAIENQCYIAGVNRIGEGGKLTYEPGSIAFDPVGNPLSGTFYQVNSCASANCHSGWEEGFWLVEMDAEAVKQVREGFPLKADRREKLYTEWYQSKL